MKLAIMVGFPCSGKSTYAKGVLQSSGWARVCPDEIRLALHGKQFITEAEPMVWAIAQTMVRTLLIGGHCVVVDAANTTRERRKMWVNMAKDFGLQLIICWNGATAEQCKKVNGQIKRLSDSIIDRMASQFEPPTEGEGKIIKFGRNDEDQAILFEEESFDEEERHL
jgi:predicted kinase